MSSEPNTFDFEARNPCAQREIGDLADQGEVGPA
jgi:hypothetical protein